MHNRRRTKHKKIRGIVPLTGILMLFCAGIGLLLYPVVSNWHNEHTALVSINSYNDSVRSADRATLEAIKNKSMEYNRKIAENNGHGITEADERAVTLDDSLGYIEIPCIQVYLPIYPGTSEDVLNHAVGHLTNTSLPVGGKSTHCVLTGHSALPEAKLFTDIDKMRIGDVFYIYSFDQKMEYTVNQIKVVLPYDIGDLGIVKDQDYVTLYTCTPYAVNTHRLLVRGVRTG